MNDYERVASVIRYLDQRQAAQPDLAELARSLGLSTSHFHRLFSAWAGVTPKDFLQCLTVAHVKARLREGESVLDAAINSGLSGPGRAHDLCVTLEAASPGEWKSGGDGIDIAYGFALTPFGEALIAESARGICHLSFVENGGHAEALQRLRADWPRARFVRDDPRISAIATDIFQPDPGSHSGRILRAFVRGTAFQVRVWRALLQVPPGRLTSYGRISAAIGQPLASRAVGGAVGANPLAFIVPCHRVIRETGVLGNYRWDPIRKRAMIGRELACPSAVDFRPAAA